MMRVYSTITKDMPEAVRIISEGRVVAFPTGTSYGLAVDALQGHALQRLRNLKKRPREKTFTIFLRQDLWEQHLNLTPEELAFLDRHANSALTLLVHPKESLQHLAQDGVVGLRLIDHPLMAQLAEAADVPLTATSANLSGEEPCYTTACILEKFPGKIDETTYDLSLGCILDGGELPQKKPTTIARIIDGQVKIIREGTLRLSSQ